MNEQELIALLTLQNTPNIGGITAKKLIAHFGSATNIFKEKRHLIEKIDGIGKIIIANLFNPIYRQQAEKEWEYICTNKVHFCTYQDKDYPVNLAQAIDGPILFFYNGNINLKNKHIISIVGTRQVTTYGIGFCEKLIENLAPLKEDLVIVSGYAYGVDITAHKAAIANGIQTIACLAHGLDTIYPASHKKYYEQMIANGGFISDFWHNSLFDRKNFLSRNRIIAGLAEAIIVVESAQKGGSLVTAEIALSYGRDVFAVPGRVTDTYSIGCNELIRKDKARILTSASDLLSAMNWTNLNKKELSITPKLFEELTPDEQPIFEYLKINGKQQLDDIARACQIPIHKLSNLLFQMEMKGIVRPLQGKFFTISN
ncbi:DNA-processing protein DprA [Capnocytophaga catalasegens]|uniref:DNA processing protein DprA n=1 Tax=Capnocytophaga catalasegens TaxID=1004260 RepID=A0AAV5ASC2_9FLAO|nr:DNA-processing protein DprA [Capnocytophaga catalasegens]GIZ16267.1 DNA processing protein DprA [Capnocytophaga catalasegens]GJM49474.1 DNA processing protein DprA [Capnocytophaga catalasegens]GJM52861.1 DNA processing protein DprA [Capnocytophaga catalasegens]